MGSMVSDDERVHSTATLRRGFVTCVRLGAVVLVRTPSLREVDPETTWDRKILRPPARHDMSGPAGC